MSDDALTTIAARHGFSADAAREIERSLRATGGRMAQFDHPELGGCGQWMPGMIMIGAMFDAALKARVAALCADLAALPVDAAAPADRDAASLAPSRQSRDWWPPSLGTPASSGAQNDIRYAWFPQHRRLLIQRGETLVCHDTGDLDITGVSQRQNQSSVVVFTSRGSVLRLERLPVVEPPPL